MDDSTLSEIRTTANDVAVAEDRYDEAITQERAALTRFVEALVDCIKPALPAICSPLYAGAPIAALRLGGARLIILENGVFARLDETDDPEAEFHVLDVDAVAELARLSGIQEIVATLTEALTAQQRGKKHKNTEKIEARVQAINALLTLIR